MFKFGLPDMIELPQMSRLIIIAIVCLSCSSACTYLSENNQTANGKQQNSNRAAQTSKGYAEPKQIATLREDSVTESSGLAVSQKNLGAFWTHNDSEGGAFLYAFDRQGNKLGAWSVKGAKNSDWEDLAIYVDPKNGESYFLIGDIGNNERTRSEAVIYRVAEPKITATDKTSSKKNPRTTEAAEAIRVSYPDQRRDAETLLVNPATGDVYIVSKSLIGKADVYKLPQPFDAKQKTVLQHVGQIGVPSFAPGFMSGGAISSDGKRLVLTDYFALYEFVLPANAKNFDEIFSAKPDKIQVGERRQGEAVAYAADGTAIFATSEKRPTPLIEIKRR